MKDLPYVSWNRFVSDMRSLILSRYDNTPISDYRAVWKQVFKTAVNNLSLSIEMNEQGDIWNEKIVDDLKEKRLATSRSETPHSTTFESSSNESRNKTHSSTSSLSYQRQLLPVDYSNISETFSKLTKKWKLKTDRIVEDVMHKASKEFIVEQ